MVINKNTLPADVSELKARVDEGARRDNETREKTRDIFNRLNSLDQCTAKMQTDMAIQFGQIGVKLEQEFGQLKKDMAVRDERYKSVARSVAGRSGAKWAAIISSTISTIAVVVYKLFVE